MKGEKPFAAAANHKTGFVQARAAHDNFSEMTTLTPQQKRRILDQRAHALAHLKGTAFALWAGLGDFGRDWAREMLHVSAGSTFPAERSQFGFAREKC